MSSGPKLGNGPGDPNPPRPKRPDDPENAPPGLEIPSWIFNPRAKILTIVATWVIGGVLFVWGVLVGGILIVFDGVQTIPDTIREAILGAGAAIGAPFLELAGTFSEIVVGFAESAGPAAPLIVLIAYLAIAVLIVKGGALLADVLDLPGVNLSGIGRAITGIPRAFWRLISRG